MHEKKSQIGVVELISGITIIIGGVMILFNMINGGSLVVTVGLLIELIKIVVKQGL